MFEQLFLIYISNVFYFSFPFIVIKMLDYLLLQNHIFVNTEIEIFYCVEEKRQVILTDLAALTKNVETLKQSVAKEEKQLDKLKVCVEWLWITSLWIMPS